STGATATPPSFRSSATTATRPSCSSARAPTRSSVSSSRAVFWNGTRSKEMAGRLTGRRVLVVGAGTRPDPDPDAPHGNGRAIAVLAAREGAAVACADVDRAAAEETARIVELEGGKAHVIVGDVSDAEVCGGLVDETVAAFGGLD